MSDTAKAVRGDWRKGVALDITRKDDIVHAICPYLRDLQDCKMCPESTDDPEHGPVWKGCYMLAKEVMNICQTGHPRRRGAQPT